MSPIQEVLVEMHGPVAGAGEAAGPAPPLAPQVKTAPLKLKPINRAQCQLRTLDVEGLIPANHRARMIWELTGKLDLSGFAEGLKTAAGQSGRPCWDPRLLVSIWVYAYSEGFSSAREIERAMEHEPGLMWLSGVETVNYHTLSDFRVQQQAALEKLFAELLAVLESEGLVDLRQVMVDGTKVRAQASMNGFHRKAKLQQHLERATAVVEQMKQNQTDRRSVVEAAQQRAARERQQRLEAALQEIEELAVGKTAEEAATVRVSESEPEARRMKQPDGGYAPSYNVQVSTDARAKMVVGVHLTQDGNDLQQLQAGVADVKQNTGRQPEQVIADGGYASRPNVLAMAVDGVDFISTLASEQDKAVAALKGRGVTDEFLPAAFPWDETNNCFVCPAGKRLCFHKHETRQTDQRVAVYRAALADCQFCMHRAQCCPHNARGRTMRRVVEDHPAMIAFREKIQQPGSQQAYKRRAAVSETVNAWLKEKMGLRRFHLRGLKKAGIEILWACLSYNVRQWIRLRPVAAVQPQAT